MKSVALKTTVIQPAAVRVRKGDVTRTAILDAALAMASREGLEGLTIGALSEALNMSKSGVFAHFGSREQLQLAVLQAYARQFVEAVLEVAVKQARGLPRLRALAERWLNYLAHALEAGCILIGSAAEYDDRQGPVRDAVVALVAGWQSELIKAVRLAMDEGHVHRDVDPRQVAFELYGLLLAAHQSVRLFHAADAVRRARVGIERLLADVATPAGVRSTEKLLPSRRAPRPVSTRALSAGASRTRTPHSDRTR